VDESSCERPNTSWGGYDPDTGDNYGFSISYETCGKVENYFSNRVTDLFYGKTLRVTYPHDSLDGYNLVSSSNVDGSTTYSGATDDLVKAIASEYNIALEVQEITEKSTSGFMHSYTACVNDVLLNETDLCIGPFIGSAQRLSMATFTTSFFDTRLFIISYREGGLTFVDELLTPLVPFTYEAWGIIIVLVCFMSSSLMFVQGRKVKRRPRSVLHWIGDNLFVGGKSFSGGGVSDESDEPSRAEKFIVFGFNVFGLIVLTAYTASSAAALVVDSSSAEYLTLKSVIDNDSKICTIWAYEDPLVGSHPEIGSLLTSKETVADSLDAMDSGECQVAILGADYFEENLGSSSTHCDKTMTEFVLSIPIAMPVSAEYMHPFSYAIRKYVIDGTYADFQEESKETYVGDPMCSYYLDEDDVITRLGYTELLCPFLITFICTSIGLVLFFVDSSKARKLQSKHIDVNELEMKETVSVENEDTCHAVSTNTVSLQTMEIIKALKAKDDTDTAKVDEAVNYMLQLLLKSSENPYLGKVTMKLKEGE